MAEAGESRPVDTADDATDGALTDLHSSRDRGTSIGLFVATLCSVFLVYGYQWMGGSPFTHPAIAWGSARFAAGLMTLLLAHEMGHYFVARAHGFRLSLPYFLPVPFAFGTFGAVIRLKSLPRDRTGLLEMGAAGPLAGFVVALLLIAVGLRGTVEHDVLEVVVPSADALQQLLTITPPVDPGLLDWVMSVPPLVWLVPPPGTWQVMILANPPIMDLLGVLVLGHAPGRYAALDPLAMAGWVGCLVTGINLLPIGQLDGGHVFNALFPRRARRFSRLALGLAVVAGLVWPGWAFWAVVLFSLGAWRSLPVPLDPHPSRRSLVVAMITLGVLALCFMPRPIQVDNIPLGELHIVTPDGTELMAPPIP